MSGDIWQVCLGVWGSEGSLLEGHGLVKDSGLRSAR